MALRLLSLVLMLVAWYVGAQFAGPRIDDFAQRGIAHHARRTITDAGDFEHGARRPGRVAFTVPVKKLLSPMNSPTKRVRGRW